MCIICIEEGWRMPMKRYLVIMTTVFLISCSSQVPNTPYYQNLAYYNNNTPRTSYPRQYQYTNSTQDLRETLYREREWHKRQLAQKDATIEGLRKELYETRMYVTNLMSELNKINVERRNTIPLYEQNATYENIYTSSHNQNANVVFASASTEIRQPIQQNSQLVKESPQTNTPLPMDTTPVYDVPLQK